MFTQESILNFQRETLKVFKTLDEEGCIVDAELPPIKWELLRCNHMQAQFVAVPMLEERTSWLASRDCSGPEHKLERLSWLMTICLVQVENHVKSLEWFQLNPEETDVEHVTLVDFARALVELRLSHDVTVLPSARKLLIDLAQWAKANMPERIKEPTVLRALEHLRQIQSDVVSARDFVSSLALGRI